MSSVFLSDRARRRFWRTAFRCAGGLEVSYRGGSADALSGPAVIVANHNSHADTAALIAALPARLRPTFVAAADYWDDVAWRRRVAAAAVRTLPVSRSGGGYSALLESVAPVLREGRVVVIYPEGSRGTDEEMGPWRAGALRLARDCGVPIVPVAIHGTRAVFGPHQPLRRGRVRLVVGAPVDPHAADLDEIRSRLVGMLDTRARVK